MEGGEKGQVFGSSDALAAELVRLTVEAATRAIATRGQFTMALTGGSAASTFYPVLAQAALPWDRVHVFFGDERCVPADHADSNLGLARRAFLSRTSIPDGNVHGMDGARDDEAAAALDYEQTLLAITDGALDVVHLGMGPDGHVCSLFPDHPLLQEDTRLVRSLSTSPKPPPRRITLTLPALARARGVWFLVAGAGKAEAVRDVLTDSACTLPAALVMRACPQARWLLDADAARLLT